MKKDSELQRDVMDELAWEPSVDAAEIGVSVENGVVILNGTVKSLAEKWTAEHRNSACRGSAGGYRRTRRQARRR